METLYLIVCISQISHQQGPSPLGGMASRTALLLQSLITAVNFFSIFPLPLSTWQGQQAEQLSRPITVSTAERSALPT